MLLVSNTLVAKPLYIEITGGQNIGIPIAVVPFTSVLASDPIDRAVEVENISEIIKRDLHNSGHFRAINVVKEQNNPKSVSEVNHGYWKNYGAADLVIGSIIPKGNGLYDVSFQLIDVYNNNAEPLLSIRFKDKYPSQFRALAHYISDLIFKKLTGVRGFFSTRIAYITVDRYKNETVHTLTIADADGFNDKPLVAANYPLMSPRWSPDGKKISFVSFKGGRSSINLVTLATGKIELLTRYPGINGAPAWSPNGQQLAIVLSKDGAPKIYLFDLATHELRKLTSGGAIDTEPFWHPSGQSILFTSNRGGKPQIYRVVLQTGEVQRITFNGNYNVTPSVTPDGKQLIMLHQSEKGAYNIAVQDLTSGRLKVITRANLDESPTLAPNGMMVLYGTRETTQNVLGAVTLDGKFRMRLPVQDSNVKEPSWSPFLVDD
ncbi:MAG TPA: Tol-Pal system beta propeller repeat protein TolB [Gammaproteobacteria bacterium]|nr:Tol-Pal system beta propeller repeat protein TolB [Gammaproteobacteria bacterium]